MTLRPTAKVPPLRWGWVHALVEAFPALHFELNGGVKGPVRATLLLVGRWRHRSRIAPAWWSAHALPAGEPRELSGRWTRRRRRRCWQARARD